MSTATEQAYAQIKNLENTGQLSLPEPQDTVTVGTINPVTGAFTWAVPTLVRTTTLPPVQGTGQKTNTIINITAGVIQTSAVDLLLKFNVEGPKVIVNNPIILHGAGAEIANVSNVKATANTLGGTSPGITIDGFPTTSSTPNEIILDAGLACSSIMQSEDTSPPVTTLPLTINVPGHAAIFLSIMIVRPPVLGIGALTIPALPIAIVYAPPQGALQKNTSTYTVAETFTRAVTTSITQSTSTKTAQAYTAADLVSKVAGAIAAVVAIVGTGGTGAAGGAAAGGALGSILSGLFGSSGSSDSGDSTANDLKTASSSLNLVSTILGSVDSSTSSDTNTATSESDHTLTIAITDMSTYTTTSGQGPGVGDIFVYFNNVRVVWMAVNGDVGIHVLDLGSLSSTTAAALNQDLQSLAGGGKASSGLDETTINMLLAYDPFCAKRRIAIGPPLVGPPRFIPGQNPEMMINGANASYSQTVDVTSEDKQVQTSTQTNITDVKPGWVSVLFGSDNTETTTTMTFTTSQTTDDKTDLKITNAVNFQASSPTDTLDVLGFVDRTFGTSLYAVRGSSVLEGITVLGNLGSAAQEATAH